MTFHDVQLDLAKLSALTIILAVSFLFIFSIVNAICNVTNNTVIKLTMLKISNGLMKLKWKL